jgi:hypothetical protein
MIPVLNPAIFLPAKRPPVASTRRFEFASSRRAISRRRSRR